MKLKLPRLRKVSVKQQSQDSVQTWLPIKDIAEGIMYRQDGLPVAVVRVQPAPFSLLSDRERERRITTLFEAIQSLPGQIQIAAVPRPIDLDQYIRDLDQRHELADGPRKRLLRGYRGYVRNLVAGAEAMEKRFFVLIVGESNAEEELLQRSREFVSNLSRAELTAHVCDFREILDLQFTFFHAAQAAFERADQEVI